MEKEIEQLVCEACSEEAEEADEDQVTAFVSSHPEWKIETEATITLLTRTFHFSNFAEASKFAEQVGLIAEQANHHPRIIIEYGKTRVDWWSHKIGNIHALDLRLAANTDQLIEA